MISGYGLTEASPVTHCNPPKDFKYHSIGPAIHNVHFKVWTHSVENKTSVLVLLYCHLVNWGLGYISLGSLGGFFQYFCVVKIFLNCSVK